MMRMRGIDPVEESAQRHKPTGNDVNRYHYPSVGLQHSVDLRQRGTRLVDVVQDVAADDDIESLVHKWQILAYPCHEIYPARGEAEARDVLPDKRIQPDTHRAWRMEDRAYRTAAHIEYALSLEPGGENVVEVAWNGPAPFAEVSSMTLPESQLVFLSFAPPVTHVPRPFFSSRSVLSSPGE